MSDLPLFRAGEAIVVEERWRNTLWAAVPHQVISSTTTMLAGWVPAGTLAVYATNRGIPETAGLSRDERKRLALRTGKAVAAEFAEAPNKLQVYQPNRWSHVNLGYADDGRFLGWYVDFQLPVRRSNSGLVTKDLVLDLWANPDRTWQWKDRDDFESAITEGIIDPEVRNHLGIEADHVLRELKDHTGAFSDDLRNFEPDPEWPHPELPASHAWGGDEWTLPTGHRARV